MKKTLFLLALVSFFAFTAKSQISVDKAKQAAAATKTNATTTATKAESKAGVDVNSSATGIMNKLSSVLALSKNQQPKVLTEVTDFLKNKSSILGLAGTDKAQYTKKLAELTSGLSGKLKGILSAAQFKKFLSLKPPKASSKNVLSQLFY